MFMTRKCQVCGRPANYKVTRIVNGKPEDAFFCDEHASKASPYIQKPPAEEAIKEWWKGFIAGAGGLEKPQEIPDVACESCGLTFEAYKRTLLLGCPDCYEYFEEYLIPELRKFHGETRHVGRTPAAKSPEAGEAPEFAAPDDEAAAPLPANDESVEQQVSVSELRRLLKDAAEREDFAQAARIRDEIRQRETRKKV